MLKLLVNGIVAGAVGTAALNAVTYLDMAVRGRPSSNVPAGTVEKMTDLAGVSLAGEESDDKRAARQEALGALLGYITGCSVGAVYGILRSGRLKGVPWPLASVSLAVAATVTTAVPYSVLGVSDPRQWSAKGWAADIVPHLCYGCATVAAFDSITAGPQKSCSRPARPKRNSTDRHDRISGGVLQNASSLSGWSQSLERRRYELLTCRRIQRDDRGISPGQVAVTPLREPYSSCRRDREGLLALVHVDRFAAGRAVQWKSPVLCAFSAVFATMAPF